MMPKPTWISRRMTTSPNGDHSPMLTVASPVTVTVDALVNSEFTKPGCGADSLATGNIRRAVPTDTAIVNAATTIWVGWR